MKRIIITILISIFIITGAVASKNLYSCRIPIKNRGISDAIASGDLDLLFIGSSTFRSNVDMHLLDDAYEGRVYDISYGGNQCVATSIQYDEIKARSDHDYGLMVFEMGPLMITEDVKLSDSRVIWDLSLKGKLDLYNEMRKAGNTDASVAYEYFITSGMDDLITYPVTERIYATRYYKGSKTDATQSPGAEVLDSEEFDISDAMPNEAQERAVRDIIEKCKRDGQAFVFLESPVYYRLGEDPVYKTYEERFIRLLEEEDAPYILASEADFDDHLAEYFEDMNHMSDAGRKAYTRELIRILKDRQN